MLPNTPLVRVVALGDIVGKAGRQCLKVFHHKIKSQYQPDIFIVNGENASGGFGISHKISRTFFEEYNCSVVTTGNHWADNRQIYDFKHEYPNLLIPANMFNAESLESGYFVGSTQNNISYAVVNLSGKVFMHPENSCPFQYADKILRSISQQTKIIIMDIHAEATSEKQALAHYLSGKMSLVFGTHTHCQTSDERILDSKTGYLTDLGMTGAYDSVIGMEKNRSIHNFLEKNRKKMKPAQDDLRLCGIYAEICPISGYCKKIERIHEKIAL